MLRHVSGAFSEDPVRILRVARFAARFHPLGFRIADETMRLMREMVAAGETSALVPERVWRETESALEEIRPDLFFRVLRDCGALAVVFPELDALFGVPQPQDWHPEIDTGVHVLMALRQAARLGASAEARFAVLVHDLGKGTTPKAEWPQHIGHEKRSVELANQLCQRLGAPNRYRELAVQVARYHGLCHRALELRAGTILELLNGIDAFRRPQRFEDFLAACEADARGRTGREDDPYPEAQLLRAAFNAAAQTDVETIRARGLEGQELGEALDQARARAIAAAIK